MIFSINLMDAYFQVPIHLDSRPYFCIALEMAVYQFKALCFGLFCSSPGLHTSLLTCVGVSSQARDSALLLFGQLACHSRVSSSLVGTLQAPPPFVQRPGLCHQYGEIRSRADQQGSVSGNADRHHLRSNQSDGTRFWDVTDKLFWYLV